MAGNQGHSDVWICHFFIPGLEAIRAIKAYLNKFPFTKEFFAPGQSIDLEGFGKRFRVKLYKFDPQMIYYLDNEIEFGFRKEVTL